MQHCQRARLVALVASSCQRCGASARPKTSHAILGLAGHHSGFSDRPGPNDRWRSHRSRGGREYLVPHHRRSLAGQHGPRCGARYGSGALAAAPRRPRRRARAEGASVALEACRALAGADGGVVLRDHQPCCVVGRGRLLRPDNLPEPLARRARRACPHRCSTCPPPAPPPTRATLPSACAPPCASLSRLRCTAPGANAHRAPSAYPRRRRRHRCRRRHPCLLASAAPRRASTATAPSPAARRGASSRTVRSGASAR